MNNIPSGIIFLDDVKQIVGFFLGPLLVFENVTTLILEAGGYMITFQKARVFVLRVGVRRGLHVILGEGIVSTYSSVFYQNVLEGENNLPAEGSVVAFTQWFSRNESFRAPFVNERHSLRSQTLVSHIRTFHSTAHTPFDLSPAPKVRLLLQPRLGELGGERGRRRPDE